MKGAVLRPRCTQAGSCANHAPETCDVSRPRLAALRLDLCDAELQCFSSANVVHGAQPRAPFPFQHVAIGRRKN